MRRIVPESDGRWTEYAGGYSDMLEQRGPTAGRSEPEKIKLAPPERPAPAIDQAPSRKRKLSFHEKHALNTLPNQINALQTDIRRLQDTLNDPNLYARDQKAFAKTSDALAAAQTKLAAVEEKWLELEILREDIEDN